MTDFRRSGENEQRPDKNPDRKSHRFGHGHRHMIRPMPRFLPLVLLCTAIVSCSGAKPLHGTALSPPQNAKRFALTDQNGSTYTLAASRAQITALYFGFTHCKDVCPQTLSKLAKARAAAGLTPQQVSLVMVTVDPHRDSPAALRAFFVKVGIQAVGLTGTAVQLQPAYRAYGVAVQPKKDDIGHTDYIYMLDSQGRLREVLSPGTAVADIASDLRALVE
jgi:protein SCO1/2